MTVVVDAREFFAAEALRDPYPMYDRIFTSANDFRLDRSSPRNHLAFGRGAHFCVANALARLEAQIVLGKLLEHITWIEVVDVGDWLPSILVRRLEHLRLAVR